MNTGMNHANSGGWEEKNEDQNLYLLISYSIAFCTMGVGKISYRTSNCLQEKDEESTLLQKFKIESKKL